jgi:hypothetical protein
VEEESWEQRYGDGENFTNHQHNEIIDYIEERLHDEYTQSDFELDMKKIDELIDLKCREAVSEMLGEMYQMKKELEEQFNLKARKSFWKWWK